MLILDKDPLRSTKIAKEYSKATSISVRGRIDLLQENVHPDPGDKIGRRNCRMHSIRVISDYLWREEDDVHA